MCRQDVDFQDDLFVKLSSLMGLQSHAQLKRFVSLRRSEGGGDFTDHVKVLYLDYGNEQWVRRKQIYPLPRICAQEPPQVSVVRQAEFISMNVTERETKGPAAQLSDSIAQNCSEGEKRMGSKTVALGQRPFWTCRTDFFEMFFFQAVCCKLADIEPGDDNPGDASREPEWSDGAKEKYEHR